MSRDNLMKRLISRAALNLIEIENSIGSLDKKIDIIIKTWGHTEQDKKLPLPKIFFELQGIHIIEFKSEKDPIKSVVLSKLLGYTGFYMENNKIGIEELERQVFSWLIFAGTRLEFTKIKNDLELTQIIKGIYKSSRFGFLFIMVIDELEFVPENEIFIINASISRFNQYLKHLMKNRINLSLEQKEYIRSRCYIDFGGVENMHEVNNYLELTEAENIASAIRYAGVKEVIDALGVKEVIDALNLKKVVDEVGIKKVVDEVGIDRVIKDLGLELFLEKVFELHDAVEIDRVIQKYKKKSTQNQNE